MGSGHLEVRSLGFTIGACRLRDIDLVCPRGQYRMLLGPTGSGKSTLIKCVLGLNRPRAGTVSLDGRDITGLPPEERRMGYLPQNYLLFPHLTVEQNIRFGLRSGSLSRGEADRQVDRLCGVMSIGHLRGRGVRNLSGGERQKVALARALAVRPEIILLDEPFSSIDEGGRRLLWFELRRIIGEIGITAVHITHNLEEAYTLGERLSVLIDGRIAQSGTKREIFERPLSESVARYLNYRNIVTGQAARCGEGTRIDAGHFGITIDEKIPAGREVTLCVRPQDLKVIREGSEIRESLRENVFAGEIVSLFSLPESCLMLFRIEGSPRRHDFELRFPAYILQRHGLKPGKKVRVAIWQPNISIFK